MARGTTQSTGVDHKRLRLRYQWGPVNIIKALYNYKDFYKNTVEEWVPFVKNIMC